MLITILANEGDREVGICAAASKHEHELYAGGVAECSTPQTRFFSSHHLIQYQTHVDSDYELTITTQETCWVLSIRLSVLIMDMKVSVRV